MIISADNFINSSYYPLEPADTQWGEVFENGTVTGMIGMVHARRAYFAINEITITGWLLKTLYYYKL